MSSKLNTTRTVTETVDSVTLELTPEEAVILRTIGRRISGCPGGARGFSDSIQSKLITLGVPYADTPKVFNDADRRQSLNLRGFGYDSASKASAEEIRRAVEDWNNRLSS